MMKISIFTPTHNPTFLERAYQTLLKQTYQDWEWIVILNSGCPDINFPDNRVKVFRYEKGSNIVGKLKKYACEKATGDILLELDHDDMLTFDALEEVAKAFSDVDIDFVYSDCVDIHQDWSQTFYGEIYGWKYYPFKYEGHELFAAISPDPNPQVISRIWYAPNHLRAWRKTFYNKIGGHNPEMVISDDHDLILRTYIHGKMYHINKPLYIYWIDGNNTWLKYAENIQDVQWSCYDKYIMQMAEKWADKNNLLKIHLGRYDAPIGYQTLDKKNSDIICDLSDKWCLDDNSTGILIANDAVTTLKEPINTMNEAWRILTHGGFLFMEVPSTDGKGAWCDPTHKSYWNDRSFRYYTEAGMRMYLEPECFCRFLPIKIENIKKYDDIPYVRAHLIAIKNDDFRFHGHLQI